MIGRCPASVPPGADVPGTIQRQPGGGALNIALVLADLGHRPALLASIGQDAAGLELAKAIAARGVITNWLHRDRATDSYIAIEDTDGLVAAIADSRGLESAGLRLLAPLRDGRLGTAHTPFRGPVALDGGLTAAHLAELAAASWLAGVDLRVIPASGGKAARLAPLLQRAGTTFYLNRAEAEILCGTDFPDTQTAARALLARGAGRALVTDGPHPASDADATGVLTTAPPQVKALRVTGAGDCFVAAHMAHEQRGQPRAAALAAALERAAAHVAATDG